MRTQDSDRETLPAKVRIASLWKRISRTVVILALAALLTTAAELASAGPPASMPALSLTSLDGAAVRSQDWLGGRPTVVNIWATWCAPCRTEMPSLQRLETLLAPDGIRVLALSVDTDHNLVREFLLKYGIKLPVSIADSPSQTMSALGVVALPQTLYVGADGRILGSHLGQRDWADPATVREVRSRFPVAASRKP
ncbi:TlpA disulfide reductase family protein [Azoarcus sp. DN11]|uniref:TlpA family protein disulfide reductase n=1 Tax=Azoarcus sp. DN11 TaxID=356837 RepID=UPI002570D344|nr:TlpA disulfide reductase family protein [Azoarcus sp. DN11]